MDDMDIDSNDVGQGYTPPHTYSYKSGMPSGNGKKSNTWLIVGIIVLVLLCCCCTITLGVAWFFGDQMMELIQNQTGAILPTHF